MPETTRNVEHIVIVVTSVDGSLVKVPKTFMARDPADAIHAAMIYFEKRRSPAIILDAFRRPVDAPKRSSTTLSA